EYSVLLPSDEAENSTVESSAAEDNAPGDSAPEHATTGYREATADYTATVSAEQVIPKRPQAMRSVIWCATAMIALGTLSNFLSVMLPWQSYIDFEMVISTLFSMLAFTLFASIIPIFILWKVWDGREWARILTIVYCAFAAVSGVFNVANNFMDSRYFSGLMDGLLSPNSRAAAVSFVVGVAIGVVITALHILMIVLLTRAPIRAYTQIVSGARALERQQMMSETRQAAGQVPAELREIFADDEDGERTSSGGNTPRPPHRSAGWGT
ncbi:multidrug ABC transporter permease, partial [Rothia mucilaginosa]